MANVSANNKQSISPISSQLRSENYMILSTTYPLNNSDTKRVQVGLRAVNGEAAFEVSIKLCGNTSAGIYFDQDTWQKFQENMEHMDNYLRMNIDEIPDPVLINNVVISFTTAYGARAITVSNRQKSSEAAAPNDPEHPPAKKRKTYTTSIVMQKTSFDGLENIINCINVRYTELNSHVNLINDCTRFLITEIELSLPNRFVDEDMVKQTLTSNYHEIQQVVQRQIKDIDFLGAYFEILFQELTSLHLYEIARTIVINRTS